MPPGVPAESSSPTHPARPWWGFGDVLIGIVAAQALSIVGVVLIYSVAGWSADVDPPIWGTALLQVPLWVGLSGVAWWAASTKGFGVRTDFWVSFRWFDAPAGVAVGVLAQLALLPLLYLPILRLLGLGTDDLSRPAKELSSRAGDGAGWIVFAVMVVVVAPVVEELFYRGLVLQSLRKRGMPAWAAVVLSAALFALMHLQPLQFAGLFVFGVVLASLVLATGRMGMAIWAHAAFNATTVLVLWLDR